MSSFPQFKNYGNDTLQSFGAKPLRLIRGNTDADLHQLFLDNILDDVDALSALAADQILDVDVVGQPDAMVEHMLQSVLSLVQVADLAVQIDDGPVEQVLQRADLSDTIRQSRVVVVLRTGKTTRRKSGGSVLTDAKHIISIHQAR
jgi:hypothetical protein